MRKHLEHAQGMTIIKFLEIYFQCNEIRPCSSNPYTEGVLACGEFENSLDRLMKFFNQINERTKLFDTKQIVLLKYVIKDPATHALFTKKTQKDE